MHLRIFNVFVVENVCINRKEKNQYAMFKEFVNIVVKSLRLHIQDKFTVAIIARHYRKEIERNVHVIFAEKNFKGLYQKSIKQNIIIVQIHAGHKQQNGMKKK